ncbi:MAG: NADH-quinone oxidoreductase subunit NuoH [Phycisphaerae bacterium]
MTQYVLEPIEKLLRRPLVIFGAAAALLVAPVALVWLGLPLLKPMLSNQFAFSILMMAISLFIIIHGAAGCIWIERKMSAWIQDRYGPNRVGAFGLLQPVADGIKFILKEDIIPKGVDKPVFLLAPCIAFVIALIGFAVIPWAGDITWPWTDADGNAITVSTQVANIDMGLLYMLAVGALSVYGVVLAGWASNSKYSFYGGMRATAQMLSYEVPLGLGLLVILMVSGTLRLDEIVMQQAKTGAWNIFLHPVAALLVIISAFAETNRAPFDLAEAEQELVGGYHTEYSAMKFSLFFLAEYSHMITNSALIVALFLGGWAPLPGLGLLADNQAWWAGLIKFGVFWGKVAAFIGFYVLIRWTLPRFRFDQLMRLAWKSLVPAGMAAILATGVLVVLDLHRSVVASLLVNVALVAAAIFVAGALRAPITGRQEGLPDIDVRPA